MTASFVGKTGAERFTVVYRITPSAGERIENLAEEITREQTVEVPADCIPENHHRLGIVGKVEKIEAADNAPSCFDVAISYHNDVVGGSILQFYNVIFGNISLKENIKITGLEINEKLLQIFPGPWYGIGGIRALLGVYNRPITCTAIKPMGQSVEHLAKLAGEFSAGGIDIIKDDHGITNQAFHPFEERVARCHDAVQKAAAAAGRTTLYCPSIMGAPDEIENQIRYCHRQGIRAILVSPMLVGPALMASLARTSTMIIMAHPSFSGTFFHAPHHGINQSVLLGTLFRLCGADISVFPNAGGRFGFSTEQCMNLCHELRKPLGTIHASFPAPAGGMQLTNIDAMAASFGSDTVLLIGGALLQHKGGIYAGTRMFMETVFKCFPDSQQTFPEQAIGSSCDWIAQTTATEPKRRSFLKFDGFKWEGRIPQDYKPSGDFDFRGIVRQQLIGMYGERTAFDLRYFEIEPGGYSSLEKHLHEHVVIGVRGRGTLLKNESRHDINPNDIAYIGPSEVHQLRNEENEPFGFYCIVDHERDKPVKP